MSINKELINQAKEQYGEKAAHVIANDLNIENWDKNLLKGCCPRHNERTGSFMWNKKKNHFHCFGCGVNVGIIDHLQQHYDYSYIEAVKKLFSEVGFNTNDLNFNTKSREKDDYFKNYKYPKEESNTNRKNVEDYLEKRCISKDVLDFAGIKQDSNSNIVFEYKDMDNKLLSVKYRPARAIQDQEAKMWFQKDSSNCPVLFNKQNIDITRPLVITEGEIDALSVMEAGELNVVSVPYGSQDHKWIEFNWEWLENFDKIIIWSDDDSPGTKMMNECIMRLGIHRSYRVEIPQEIKEQLQSKVTANLLRNDKGDANNILIGCGKVEVLNLIVNAKEVPSKKLKFLMDCEEVDIQNITKVSTGFSGLDRVIYGSLMGCFTIITGYTGEGKSVFANQTAIVSPVENGFNSMVFSGELSSGQLKNWLMKPLAGYNHMIEWKNDGQPNGYTVSEQAKKAIEEYYKDKIILYDDEDTFDTSAESILKEMEYSFKKYGTKFFLIDNLMVIDMQSDNDDKWELQKQFIKKLLKFSIKFDVNVSLIIHPKKPEKGGSQNAYSIAGSSDMPNLCHRLLWISRLKDDTDGYDTEIKIIKDRPTGMAGKSIKLYYDRKTMRMYTNNEELKRKYSWEINKNIIYPDVIKPRLICNIKSDDSVIFG